MTVASFEGKTPRIGAGTYVHPSADVFGDVTVGKECWIGPGVRIRGDYGTIVIGDYCSVEDNCVIHVDAWNKTVIGENVTVGHGAVVHGAVLADDVLVGMNATVLSGAEIGAGSLIGASTLVKQGMKVPPGSLVLGVPGKIVKEGDEGLLKTTRDYSQNYQKLRDEHKSGKWERYLG